MIFHGLTNVYLKPGCWNLKRRTITYILKRGYYDDKEDNSLLITKSSLRKPDRLARRTYGNLANLSYYLNPGFTHKIVKDSTDTLVLISVRK